MFDEPDAEPTTGEAEHTRSALVAVLPEQLDEPEDVHVPAGTDIPVPYG
jgi:hypothetical protein